MDEAVAADRRARRQGPVPRQGPARQDRQARPAKPASRSGKRKARQAEGQSRQRQAASRQGPRGGGVGQGPPRRCPANPKTPAAPRDCRAKQEILDFLRDRRRQGRQARDRARLRRQGRRPRRAQRAAARDGRRRPARGQPQAACKQRGTLPPVTVLEIVGARSRRRARRRARRLGRGSKAPPRAHAACAERKRDSEPALGIGDRVLARITRLRRRCRGYRYRGASRSSGCRASQAAAARHLPRRCRAAAASSIPSTASSSRNGRSRAGDQGDAKNGDLVRFELARARPLRRAAARASLETARQSRTTSARSA